MLVFRLRRYGLPSKQRRQTNIELMLVERLRRWLNINTTLTVGASAGMSILIVGAAIAGWIEAEHGQGHVGPHQVLTILRHVVAHSQGQFTLRSIIVPPHDAPIELVVVIDAKVIDTGDVVAEVTTIICEVKLEVVWENSAKACNRVHTKCFCIFVI